MFSYIKYQNRKFLVSAITRLMVFVLSFLLIFSPSASYAQSVFNLPVPGTMIPISTSFSPVVIRGLNIYPNDPFKFDFIIDEGDTNLSREDFSKESTRLVKYFLASLTVPEEKMWVNLSPYEKDRIIPEIFGRTEMGRDLLAQDYLLKQLASTLMYPESDLGNEFWNRVYSKAQAQYGTTEIPINTFNKIWIVPAEATIYEHRKGAFIVESHLKIMLEEDYLALESNVDSNKHGLGDKNIDDLEVINGVSAQIVKEILIPEIEKEVNEGTTFANLRQIYHSMLLATWYKQTLRDSLLGKNYVNQSKTLGVEVSDKEINQKIYNQYVESFKKGVFNFIKEDYDTSKQEIIPRKYFSGGVDTTKREYRPTTMDLAMSVADDMNGQIVTMSLDSDGGKLSSSLGGDTRKMGLWDRIKGRLGDLVSKRDPGGTENTGNIKYAISEGIPEQDLLYDHLDGLSSRLFREKVGYYPEEQDKKLAYLDFLNALQQQLGDIDSVQNLLYALQSLQIRGEKWFYYSEYLIEHISLIIEQLKLKGQNSAEIVETIDRISSLTALFDKFKGFAEDTDSINIWVSIISQENWNVDNLNRLYLYLQLASREVVSKVFEDLQSNKGLDVILNEMSDQGKLSDYFVEQATAKEQEERSLREAPLDWKYVYTMQYGESSRASLSRQQDRQFGLFYSQVFAELPFQNKDGYLFWKLWSTVSDIDRQYQNKDDPNRLVIIRDFQSMMSLLLRTHKAVGLSNNEARYLFVELLKHDSSEGLERWLHDTLIPFMRGKFESLNVETPRDELTWENVSDSDVLIQIAAGTKDQKGQSVINSGTIFKRVEGILKTQKVDLNSTSEVSIGLAYAFLLKYWPPEYVDLVPRDLVKNHTMDLFNLGLILSQSTPWNRAFLADGNTRALNAGYNILGLSSELGHLLAYTVIKDNRISQDFDSDGKYYGGVRQEFYDRMLWLVAQDQRATRSTDALEYISLKHLQGLEILNNLVNLPINSRNIQMISQVFEQYGISLDSELLDKLRESDTQAVLDRMPRSFAYSLFDTINRMNENTNYPYDKFNLSEDVLNASVNERLFEVERRSKENNVWEVLQGEIDSLLGVNLLSLTGEARARSVTESRDVREISTKIFHGLEAHQVAEILNIEFKLSLNLTMYELGLGPSLQPYLVTKLIAHFVKIAEEEQYTTAQMLNLIWSIDADLLNKFVDELKAEGISQDLNLTDVNRETVRNSRERRLATNEVSQDIRDVDELISQYSLEGKRKGVVQKLIEIVERSEDKNGVSQRIVDEFLEKLGDSYRGERVFVDAVELLSQVGVYIENQEQKISIIGELLFVMQETAYEGIQEYISQKLDKIIISLSTPEGVDSQARKLMEIIEERYNYHSARVLANISSRLNSEVNREVFNNSHNLFFGEENSSYQGGRLAAPMMELIAISGSRFSGELEKKEVAVEFAITKLSDPGDKPIEGYDWFYKETSAYIRILGLLSIELGAEYISSRVEPIIGQYLTQPDGTAKETAESVRQALNENVKGENNGSSPVKSTKGGIDLNPTILDLNLEKRGEGVTLPISPEPLTEVLNINGLFPVIINITPITNVPLLFGEVELDENQQLSQL